MYFTSASLFKGTRANSDLNIEVMFMTTCRLKLKCQSTEGGMLKGKY